MVRLGRFLPSGLDEITEKGHVVVSMTDDVDELRR